MSEMLRYAVVETDNCRYIIQDTAPVGQFGIDWSEVRDWIDAEEIGEVLCWCVPVVDLRDHLEEQWEDQETMTAAEVQAELSTYIDEGFADLVTLDEFCSREDSHEGRQARGAEEIK